MSDLVEFLLARLANDEQYAWEFHRMDCEAIRTTPFPCTCGYEARVLAEVAAKRQQIDMTFRYEATIDGEWGCCHEAESIARGECPAIPVDDIRMLRLLALPYASHESYRPEWKLP